MDTKYERKVHDAVVASEFPSEGFSVRDFQRYNTSLGLFDALQEVRDSYDRPLLRITRALYKMIGLGNGVPSYFIVSNFDPDDSEHRAFITSGNSEDFRGSSFIEDLRLEDRLSLGQDGRPLVLNEDGRIIYSNAQFANGVGKMLKEDNKHSAGVTISNVLGGISVYTIESTGIINRYRAGEVTFSTDSERISEVNEHILPDVREVILGKEQPIDLVDYGSDITSTFFRSVHPV